MFEVMCVVVSQKNYKHLSLLCKITIMLALSVYLVITSKQTHVGNTGIVTLEV